MSTLSFLLIEDDEIERMKFQRVVSKYEPNHIIVEATNGEEALEILNDDNQPLPDIILLDLNMPKMNGIEFLTLLKNHDRFKYLPTIVLSTSNNHQDLLECYKTGIAGYIVKPLKYEDYALKIQSMVSYWESNELIKG
ncbi:response regulator [Aquimarina rhabdastrellae]